MTHLGVVARVSEAMAVSYLAAGLFLLVGGLEDIARGFPWHYYDASEPLANGVNWGDIGVLTGGSALFALLLARMPLATKYKLTKDLWEHVGPSSRKVIRVGADATLDDVLSAAEGHISDVVVRYTIPDQLERRFEWLTAGDVQLKQQLLNHLLDAERELVIDAVEAQFPVMRSHADGRGGEYTTRLAQIVSIGKHELELMFDQTVLGVTLEEPSPRWASSGSADANWNWIWWVIAGGGLVAVLTALSER